MYGYGTAGMKIPEGHIRVKAETDDRCELEQEILYPFNSDSMCHMTETQDQLIFVHYNKNDGECVADLHHGRMRLY